MSDRLSYRTKSFLYFSTKFVSFKSVDIKRLTIAILICNIYVILSLNVTIINVGLTGVTCESN